MPHLQNFFRNVYIIFFTQSVERHQGAIARIRFSVFKAVYRGEIHADKFAQPRLADILLFPDVFHLFAEIHTKPQKIIYRVYYIIHAILFQYLLAYLQ